MVLRKYPYFLLTLLLGAALLGSASAGSLAEIRFLKDGAMGPVGPAEFSNETPTSPTPSIRPILAGTPDLPSLEIVITPRDGANYIAGPIFMGFWPGPSAEIDGNLTAMLLLRQNGTLISLGNGTTSVSLDPDRIPTDPTSLIPPNPTDPQATAFFLVAKAVPIITTPPVLFNFGNHVIELAPGDEIVARFFVEGVAAPVPIGLFATVQYDSLLSPTYLYLPWFNVTKTTSTSTTSASTSTSTSSSSSSSFPSEPVVIKEDKKSPGFEAGIVILGLVAVAMARRRI